MAGASLVRSAPEQKVPPAPVRITTRMSLFASASTQASSMRPSISELKALRASGRFMLSTITGRVSLLNKNKAALARPPWWLCDASRAREELGWHPLMPLQRGVQETYLWYVNAGWLRSPKPAAKGREEERKA